MMSTASVLSLRRALAVACALLFVASSAAAQPTSARSAPRPLRYFEVHVPEDRVEQWPLFGYQLDELYETDLERTDFHRLVQNVKNRPKRTGFATLRIEAIEGQAVLRGDTLVGTAAMDVHCTRNGPSLLSLEGCGIAIGEAQWDDDRQGEIGLAPDGTLVAVVEKPGRLLLQWSLRATRESSGALRFNVRLPRSAHAQLKIQAPRNVHLAATPGVVVPPQPDDEASPWTIELGSVGQTLLLVRSGESATAAPGKMLTQQHTDYVIDDRGFRFTSEISLKPRGTPAPLSRLTLTADLGLHITSVAVNGRAAEWELSRLEGRDEIVVTAGAPLSPQSAHRVQISGLGSLPLARAVALPTLRPERVVWQFGTAQIEIGPHLQLTQADVEGGELTALSGSKDAAQSSWAEVRFYDVAGRATVAVDRPDADVTVQPTYVWRLGPDAVEARLLAELHCTAGTAYEVAATIAPSWTVEEKDIQVYALRGENENGERAARLDSQISTALGGRPGEAQPIRVSFDAPLSPDQPVLLEIVARRRDVPLDDAIALSELIFADLDYPNRASAVGALAAVSPYRVRLRGDATIRRIGRQELSEAAAEWIGNDAAVAALRIDEDGSRLAVQLVRDPPRVEVDIQMSAVAQPAALVETYDVHCRPDATGIDRLTIQLWPPRAAPLSWSIAGEPPESDVEFRRASRDPSDNGPEVWDVVFRQRRTSPFVLRAVRSSAAPGDQPQPISLMSLEDAASQTGRVIVQAQRGLPLRIEHRNVRLLAAPSPASEETVTWGAFRYDPNSATAVGDVSLSLARASSGSGAWAWQMILESQFGGGAASIHRATWLIRNQGAAKVNVTVPADAAVHAATVNGIPVNGTERDGPQVSLPLPADAPLATLAVEFSTPASPPAMIGHIRPPRVSIDVPVLRRQWRTTLPEGYAATGERFLQGQLADAPSWARRLFGSLYAGSEPGTRAAAGLAAAHPSKRHGVPQDSKVDRLLRNLSQPDATWGQALLDYQLAPGVEEFSPGSPSILIDAFALLQAGVRPETPVGVDRSAAEPDTQVLKRAGLALLVSDRGLLLTGADSLQIHRHQLDVWADANIASVVGDWLSKRLSSLPAESREFVTPQVWVSPLSPTHSFHQIEQPAPLASQTAESSVMQLALPEDGRTRLGVYHQPAFRTLCFGALLMALAVAAWLPAARWREQLAASFAFACLALVLPSPAHGIASGIALGLALGAAFGALRPLASPDGSSPADAQPSAGVWVAAQRLGLFVVGVVLAAMPAHGQTEGDQRSAPAYPVWVIGDYVDEQFKPSGFVVLPKEFYKQLEQREKEVAAGTEGWLIRSADYELHLQRDASGAALEVDELRISYDIQLLAEEPTQVSIPLPREGLTLLEPWIKLDGQSVSDPVWRFRGAAIEIPIEEKGIHRLELRVRPIAEDSGGYRRVDVRIPSLVNATLKVHSPADAAGIEVVSSLGSIEQKPWPADDDSDQSGPQPNLLEAALGPASRLRVRWPTSSRSIPEPATFDLEELYWLKLDGDESRLEVILRGDLQEGELRQLAADVSARLELLKCSCPHETEPLAGQPSQRYRFTLPRSRDAELRAEFRVADLPSVGQTLLPAIDVSGAQNRQRFLAVTAPANRRVQIDSVGQRIDEKEFLRRWGETTDSPADAFRMKSGDAPPSLLLRPDYANPRCEETLRVVFSSRSTQLQYRAQIDAPARPVLQYELQTPPQFEIEDVTLRTLGDGDAPPKNVLAWFHQQGTRLRVFLREPTSAAHEVLVNGATAREGQGRLPLPQLSLSDVESLSRRVEIYRQSDVLVDVVQLAGYTRLEPEAPLPDFTELGRRTAILEEDVASDDAGNAQPPRCVVEIQSNRPNTDGFQVAHLIRRDDTWRLLVDHRLTVSGGVLDALRLRIPPSIQGQLELEPALTHRILSAPEGGSRELLIMPHAAIEGEVRIQLRAQYAVPPGQVVQVPDIRPLNVHLDRYVALPRSFETQSIAWQTDRLRLVADAQRRKELGVRRSSAALYQMTGDSFYAELTSVKRVTGVPLARLADIRFAWTAGGNCCGFASFDLEPAGLERCSIRVPSPMRLVHVTVGELPAQYEQDSPQRWHIELRPHGLPQRIEVYYEGRLDREDDARIEAAAPMLEDIAVERTLWSVHAPAWAGTGKPAAGGEIAAWQQDMLRLRSLTELIRLPRYLRVENTEQETRDWFLPWDRRWQALRRDVMREQLMAGAGSSDTLPLADLHVIDNEHQQILADLNLEEMSGSGATSTVNTPEQMWRYAVARHGSVVRCMIKGSSRQLTIHYAEPVSRQSWLPRLLAGGTLGGFALLLLTAPRWMPRGDWPLQCGRAVGVGLGIGWALLLWPPALGWAIVLIFLLPVRWARLPFSVGEARSAIVVRSLREDAQK